MSEMVERVAKVLADRHQAFATSGYDWQFFLDGAHDAIEAMREPTEGMLEAVLQDNSEDDEADLANWQAMIDAALK